GTSSHYRNNAEGFSRGLFSCLPDISLLFLIPCSDALDHLLLHPISTATGSVTARLPSNNNVIKTKLRQ
ncbi:hypothetical protein, partial [Prevotella corporis]|uniref:hypothetical protein n=1 Tax=Prevotella corporis TaxID=28128 RepID=UPI001E289AB5